MRLRILTYNIHKGRGLDGRQRLDRILDVLGEVDADVVALQEVFASQARTLAAATGMHAVFGPTRALDEEPYGNLSLSRFPVVDHRRYNLTCRPFEPRGCLRADVDVDGGGGRLHVFNVHLGLHYRERVRQAGLLARIARRDATAGRLIVLGDFNEWFHGRASRLLRRRFGPPGGRSRPAPGVATHPSPLPVFPLDRIYAGATVRVLRAGVHRSRLARVASDHLPTFADLDLGHPPGPRERGLAARG